MKRKPKYEVNVNYIFMCNKKETVTFTSEDNFNALIKTCWRVVDDFKAEKSYDNYLQKHLTKTDCRKFSEQEALDYITNNPYIAQVLSIKNLATNEYLYYRPVQQKE